MYVLIDPKERDKCYCMNNSMTKGVLESYWCTLYITTNVSLFETYETYTVKREGLL